MLRPEDACQKCFHGFQLDSKGAKVWIPKVQKCVNRISVNFVDLVKSFQTSILYLLATFGVDTAENGPLKVCKKLASREKK